LGLADDFGAFFLTVFFVALAAADVVSVGFFVGFALTAVGFEDGAFFATGPLTKKDIIEGCVLSSTFFFFVESFLTVVGGVIEERCALVSLPAAARGEEDCSELDDTGCSASFSSTTTRDGMVVVDREKESAIRGIGRTAHCESNLSACVLLDFISFGFGSQKRGLRQG
jgi:hypothetical protein